MFWHQPPDLTRNPHTFRFNFEDHIQWETWSNMTAKPSFFPLLWTSFFSVSNHFDPNIESSLASHFGNNRSAYTETAKIDADCATIKLKGGRNDFTTFGNSCWSCCEIVFFLQIEWKVNFYEWNENDNAYSFKSLSLPSLPPPPPPSSSLFHVLSQFGVAHISTVPAPLSHCVYAHNMCCCRCVYDLPTGFSLMNRINTP